MEEESVRLCLLDMEFDRIKVEKAIELSTYKGVRRESLLETCASLILNDNELTSNDLMKTNLKTHPLHQLKESDFNLNSPHGIKKMKNLFEEERDSLIKAVLSRKSSGSGSTYDNSLKEEILKEKEEEESIISSSLSPPLTSSLLLQPNETSFLLINNNETTTCQALFNRGEGITRKDFRLFIMRLRKPQSNELVDYIKSFVQSILFPVLPGRVEGEVDDERDEVIPLYRKWSTFLRNMVREREREVRVRDIRDILSEE